MKKIKVYAWSYWIMVGLLTVCSFFAVYLSVIGGRSPLLNMFNPSSLGDYGGGVAKIYLDRTDNFNVSLSTFVHEYAHYFDDLHSRSAAASWHNAVALCGWESGYQFGRYMKLKVKYGEEYASCTSQTYMNDTKCCEAKQVLVRRVWE